MVSWHISLPALKRPKKYLVVHSLLNTQHSQSTFLFFGLLIFTIESKGQSKESNMWHSNKGQWGWSVLSTGVITGKWKWKRFKYTNIQFNNIIWALRPVQGVPQMNEWIIIIWTSSVGRFKKPNSNRKWPVLTISAKCLILTIMVTFTLKLSHNPQTALGISDHCPKMSSLRWCKTGPQREAVQEHIHLVKISSVQRTL